MTQCTTVDRVPGKVGGAWCFAGTRMPVASFFDHLDTGTTIDEFLEWFPGVTPDHLHQVLAFVKQSLFQAAEQSADQPATAA